MIEARLLLCTCPNADTAAQIARALVEERLAACVNCAPGLTSTYRWQGEVHEHTEVLLLIKTTVTALEPLQQRLCQLHPYEVPELIVLDIRGGLPDYLQWLCDSVYVSDRSLARS